MKIWKQLAGSGLAFALAVLVFALVWFNLIIPAGEARDLPHQEAVTVMTEREQTEREQTEREQTEKEQTDREQTERTETEEAGGQEETAAGSYGSGKTGTETGDLLPDFETELLGGGTFHLASFRGQVVVINLWATTCAPCIEELPAYEQLKEEKPEVEILAIHHRAGAKKAEEFLSDKGWDRLDFALDSKEKGLYTLLGAGDALPQTIVLNRLGEITYYAQAPLNYEQLEALVDQ